MNYVWNSTVHVKLEVDGSKLVVYIADQRVGEASIAGTSGKIGFFTINQPASFDNLAITK